MPTGEASRAILERPSVHHCGQKGCDDFTASTKEEMLQHKRTVEHEYVGAQLCFRCKSVVVEFKKRMILGTKMTEFDIPVYCPPCLKAIVEEQKAA